MEFILEFLFEIVAEGIAFFAFNEKISKWIRYPLLGIIILFFILVIGLFFFLGFFLFSKSIVFSLFFFFIGILFLIVSIKKLKNHCLKRKI